MEKEFIYIAITGPESSGKSTLAEQLSSIYKCGLVKEFARSYLKDNNYNREDVLYMAEMQIQLEEEAKQHGSQLIICDTDLINFKIWLNYYRYEVPTFILNHISKRRYDFSLLLYPNTKWVNDGLRDKPEERNLLFDKFEKELQNYDYHYAIIDHLAEGRSIQACKAIDAFLKTY
ncbi:MAG: ATP-binding protein [Chitinophagales bacterium]|nr:ATP-binding protein [Chitinophagales bacterium]